ncbi:hypothetical protein [Litchfieldia alkalitelluris]|uniref:hypothetical protein n=1 Tax=Litchfieldia alkalitelluris TaxID=304268 RepID=UPI0009976BF0|nr:hypothetical protein [Litchfieldia alkalitelluris]
MANMGGTEGKQHPIRRDWLKILIIVIYSVGFAAILGMFIKDLISLPQTNHSTTIQQTKQPSNTEQQTANIAHNKATLTTLVVEPIVTNPIILSIVKHIFYLLVWIFLFLLFPVAFTRLKRLKFFNFEFEVEKQGDNLINVLNVTTQKIYFLSKWSREEYANGYAEMAKNFDTIEEGIELVLKSLCEHYLETWDYVVDYKVYTGEGFKRDYKIPMIVKNAYELAQKRMEGIPINKENKDHIYIKNYLLTVVEYEGRDYAVALSSFDLEFDEYDAILISGLVSLALQYYERTEMLELLELIVVEEA